MTRATALRAMTAAISLLIVSFLVIAGSRGAFFATTDNPGNMWSAGTVVIFDDDVSAMFTAATDMKPGAANAVQNCILVTYSGSLIPADVALYGTAGGTGLSDYLDATVEIGTGGTFNDCTGFVPSPGPPIYTGTLTAFAGTHVDFGSGVGGWSPAATPESLTYRFTFELQDDNNAQGLDATAGFTWEAQNS